MNLNVIPCRVEVHLSSADLPFGAFWGEKPISKALRFETNKKITKFNVFFKVFATFALIFLLFRTREYIVIHNRIGPRGPFWFVEFNIFIKIHKEMWESHFLRWLFSIPFSVPFWDRFSSFFGVPKFPILFNLLRKSDLGEIPRHAFSCIVLQVRSEPPKCPKKVSKMLPK